MVYTRQHRLMKWIKQLFGQVVWFRRRVNIPLASVNRKSLIVLPWDMFSDNSVWKHRLTALLWFLFILPCLTAAIDAPVRDGIDSHFWPRPLPFGLWYRSDTVLLISSVTPSRIAIAPHNYCVLLMIWDSFALTDTSRTSAFIATVLPKGSKPSPFLFNTYTGTRAD